MGNWRTVTIVGTCPPDQVEALSSACDYGSGSRSPNYEKFHCLSMNRGLCGLGYWVQENIDASGNLAERDYEVQDVADQLEALAKIAPSLAVKVHCGGDWEDPECIATVTLKEGKVTISSPEVSNIRGASQDEMLGRLARDLSPGR